VQKSFVPQTLFAQLVTDLKLNKKLRMQIVQGLSKAMA
jgi:hypothetical protein